uniref:cysteine--tRNA ligase n=1 Tax=Culex pipiens TaxID=7175 RepID=A0A8D8BT73_CULPI
MRMTMLPNLRHIRQFCSRSRLRVPPQQIRIYSCKERAKVPLQLASDPCSFTSFYTCGPTVYDSAHIGHASCYVRLDILQRILRDHFRLRLVSAMNITDIDDKIIKRAGEDGRPWQDVSRRYEQEFWGDLQRLNVRLPDIRLRVTDHIPAIVSFVEALIREGFAYKSSDQSVYFETSKYSQYGKLQNIPTVEESASESKKSAADFALWKAAKPGEPSWESPFGPGRPGWHIECSTLATQIFGKRLDFHAGGLDLRFPHHENEEAQSCCYHGVQDWVQHWIHTGQLHLEGQTAKMSKSLKNTISIGELLERSSADEFRMLCLLSHYRSAIEFGDQSMTVATNVLRKFHSFFDDSRAYVGGVKPATVIDSGDLQSTLQEIDLKIDDFLRNDFNTASAITSLGDLTSVVHKSINQKPPEAVQSSESGTVQAITNYIRDKLNLFGLESLSESSRSGSNSKDPDITGQIIDSVVQIRNSVRGQAIDGKDRRLFAVCDQMRDELKQAGVEVKDHGRNSSWSFAKR